MGNVRRKRTDRSSNRVAILAVTVVVVSLAVVLGIRENRLKAKEQQYMEREQALILQVAEEKERAQKLEEYRVYVQTKQFVEKTAEEKLGLVKKDEKQVKPKN